MRKSDAREASRDSIPPYRQDNEMSRQLSEHIRTCYERTQEAERCTAAEPAHRAFHFQAAKRWTLLARSYEFAERLECLLHDLDRSGTKTQHQPHHQADWLPIVTVPFDRDLRLAVIDQEGIAHALVVPCRRVFGGWLKAERKLA